MLKTQEMHPSRVKNELLNQKHWGKWFPVLKWMIVSIDPLKYKKEKIKLLKFPKVIIAAQMQKKDNSIK